MIHIQKKTGPSTFDITKKKDNLNFCLFVVQQGPDFRGHVRQLRSGLSMECSHRYIGLDRTLGSITQAIRMLWQPAVCCQVIYFTLSKTTLISYINLFLATLQ